MKCLYIGDFRKTYSTENYVVHGLRENNVVVKMMDSTRVAPLKDILEYVDYYQPDFVLFSKNTWECGKELIRRLREKKILTASWIFDLYHNLPKEMASKRSFDEVPFHTDIVFMTDGGAPVKNKVVLRQGIHAPDAVYGNKSQRQDVIFLGSETYFDRRGLIKFLREMYGKRFGHYGAGGQFPEVRDMELNDLLASVKIVVGDSVPSKDYWSNRIYEVLGRGGFLIHPKVEGLEKEFEYYKHFVPFEYGNYDQLKEIIDYYLAHDKEREKIRKAGHEYCKKHYTYTKRCQQLIKVVSEKASFVTQPSKD